MPDEPQQNQPKDPAPASVPGEEPQTETKSDIGAGKTVLLVEDDPTSAALVRNLLKSHGYEVIEAGHGKEAWYKMTPECRPCLVVCDVMMPEMDGFNLYKNLRQNTETEKIPVIIISSRKAMADTFLSMGADEFMAKPLDTKKFLDLAHTLSERGHIILQEANSDKPKEEEKDKDRI